MNTESVVSSCHNETQLFVLGDLHTKQIPCLSGNELLQIVNQSAYILVEERSLLPKHASTKYHPVISDINEENHLHLVLYDAERHFETSFGVVGVFTANRYDVLR